ncbi:MAG: PfkB family carbohydrate kinase [Leadbetterella sp.]|nr:PfkB family carbohydrate kinase [Leadbetterella sp.]
MIKIFSTYTKDEIHNQDSDLRIVRNGGPAFFIENVFKENKIKYEITSQKAVIEIKVKNEIEKGFLKNKLKVRSIKNIKNSDLIVISTVDNEWVPDIKSSDKAQIFLDVQGYVRSARKNQKIYKAGFWNNIFCLKTNDQEIKELPKETINKQKNKCLIMTRGSRGAVVYFKNKKHIFTAKKIKSRDTIGAGDTFFASFITGFIKSKGNIEKSGKFAIKEAEKFLLSKKSDL